jgi:hypothetical protein
VTYPFLDILAPEAVVAPADGAVVADIGCVAAPPESSGAQVNPNFLACPGTHLPAGALFTLISELLFFLDAAIS